MVIIGVSPPVGVAVGSGVGTSTGVGLGTGVGSGAGVAVGKGEGDASGVGDGAAVGSGWVVWPSVAWVKTSGAPVSNTQKMGTRRYAGRVCGLVTGMCKFMGSAPVGRKLATVLARYNQGAYKRIVVSRDNPFVLSLQKTTIRGERRLQHPHYPGTTRPQECGHDDLHPRVQSTERVASQKLGGLAGDQPHGHFNNS